MTEQDIKLMIKDVERYNRDKASGQIQSSAGFKLWCQNKKEKVGREPKQIATSSYSEPILTQLPPPDSDS